MLQITGKYTTADVMIDNPDESVIQQLYRMVNSPGINNHVVIMPDTHVGVGSVIGFTMPFTDRVIPNIVGVDIGCGMLTVKLHSRPDMTLEQIDTAIRACVPTGKNVHADLQIAFGPGFKETFKRVGMNVNYAECSIGTLGGGNHFIELGTYNDDLYVTVHTGSRNLGVKVCKYHQDIAMKPVDLTPQIDALKLQHKNGQMTGAELGAAINTLKSNRIYTTDELAYLTGEALDLYLYDMQIAQQYAVQNRQSIVFSVLRALDVDASHIAESVHNYIDVKDSIIRKGAIAAHRGSRVIIPISRTFGTIIGTGRGRVAWNFSAPHGAGRVMSRSEANSLISQDDATQYMRDSGVYSSFDPTDEDDRVYKDPQTIINAIADTVTVDYIIKPILNIK